MVQGKAKFNFPSRSSLNQKNIWILNSVVHVIIYNTIILPAYNRKK